MIHKAAIAAKKFGPKSSKKFGKNFLLRVSKEGLNYCMSCCSTSQVTESEWGWECNSF